MIRLVTLAVALTLASTAYATSGTKPHPVPKPPRPPIKIDADINVKTKVKTTDINVVKTTNKQAQDQSQSQGQKQTQSAKATADASNDGNTQDMSIVHEDELQAPSVVAPSVFPTAVCQGGVSAGASVPGFGVSFGKNYSVRESCLFVLAQNYMALGLTEAACQVLNSTESAKSVGVVAACDQYGQKKAVMQEVVTREEVDEKIKRVFEATQTK